MKERKLFQKLLTALFCIILSLSCSATAASAENSDQKITVGLPVDRCPIFYIDEKSGEIAGIGADLMRVAAENAGYEVAFVPVEEKNLKSALDNSDYDLVIPFGSAVSSASGKPVVVSENLFQTPFTLVTTVDQGPLTLDHLRVGMQHSLGAGAETVKQLYPDIKIILYDTMEECVEALRAGEVDALLHNSYVWSYVLQKPSYADLAVQPSSMFSMDFRAGTPDTLEGRTLIARLNKGIAMLSDTRRQAIILDYTSRRLYRYDFQDYLYQYGLVLFLIFLLFVSLIVIALQRIRSLRRKQAERVRWLTDHDALTGVLSMNGFRKRVEELLHEHPDIPYLLAYTNIKNFKFINETMGRATGDELLRFWADKAMENLSDADAIGRLESDHFVVLRRTDGEDKIRMNDESVINSMRSYFTDRGKENRVQMCGGIYVLTPEDYLLIDVDHMLDLARIAEKKVRETQKDGYAFYNPKQWEKGKRTTEMIGHLSTALRSGEIQVWYQPQVDYDTGKLTGAEALCRWNHSSLGWISPAEFIPTLEEAGLIHELDFFVWDRVCRDLQKWNREGLRRSVSVNLSRCDIKENQDISEHFLDLVHTYGIEPDQLRIEITETVFVEDPDVLITTTEKLREAGFQVEMDDFGSGYSSLNMLKDVPVDQIKLDLHFLTKSGSPEKSRTIIRYMVQMVHSLGMTMLAEGVETAEQAQFLQAMGCSEMQGYYFHKPMPVQDFEHISASI